MIRLEDAQHQHAGRRGDAVFSVVAVLAVPMSVDAAVVMAAAQQPNAGDVHHQAQAGNRDRLAEADRHGGKQPRHSLEADQQRDRGQHDGAGEAGKVAQFAGAEAEPAVMGVFAGEAIGERRQQQGAGMGAHMQPVRDKGDGAEQQAAGGFGQHHAAAQGDDPPGAAFGLLVASRQENVRVRGRDRQVGHGGGFHFR